MMQPFFVKWLTVHIISGPIILEAWIIYTLPYDWDERNEGKCITGGGGS
jgi:hypothetical protein